jgi:hypothetical protein
MAAWPDLDPMDLSAAPPDTIRRLMPAVRSMDRDTLDSFVRRMWRIWSPGSLGALAVAVDLRRSQLDGE